MKERLCNGAGAGMQVAALRPGGTQGGMGVGCGGVLSGRRMGPGGGVAAAGVQMIANDVRACSMPSSSTGVVTKSACCFTSSEALPMATPMPQ